jgi:general L-amino acid transport system permease protein
MIETPTPISGTAGPPGSRPRGVRFLWRWLRGNLFDTWYNGLLTVALVAGMATVVQPVVTWVFQSAHWAAVTTNMRLFVAGLYPAEQLWRPGILLSLVAGLFGGSASHGRGSMRFVALLLGALLMLLALLPIGQARLYVALAWCSLVGCFGLDRLLRLSHAVWGVGWFLSLPVVMVVLRGAGGLGLEPVATSQWGGLMLTVLLAAVGILASFPLGLLLALGRQSTLPVMRVFSIVYIEVIRGVPLVSVLMLFALLLPLFLPAGVSRPAMLWRVMVGLTAFSAAYVAENVRGGLQAIPKGQYEAATALGLSWVQSMRYIILPQALRAVIPALVGQFISLFKDTSLATIVGLLELLGIAKSVIEQPAWKNIPGGVVFEVFVFTALVYFVFTYNMSLASRRLERTLGVGRR